MKKLLMCLVMVGLGLTLMTSQALAIDSGSLIGALQIQFENVDVAAVYTQSAINMADNQQDSFALINVTNINKLPNYTNVWNQSGSEKLTGILYGLDDVSVSVGSFGPGIFTQYITSTGGYIDIYLKSTGIDSTTNDAPTLAQLQALGLTAPADQWGAVGTNDQLYLRLGIDAGTYSSTLTYNSLTGEIVGSSSAYLTVLGGSAASLFDSNLYANGSDFYLYDSFSTVSLSSDQAEAGWTVASGGNVLGTGVPEPASMILMGIGLFGAARLRRKA